MEAKFSRYLDTHKRLSIFTKNQNCYRQTRKNCNQCRAGKITFKPVHYMLQVTFIRTRNCCLKFIGQISPTGGNVKIKIGIH